MSVGIAILAILPWAVQAQDQAPAAPAPAAAPARTPAPLIEAWAAKPLVSPFVAPDRPHWKLSEILASHSKTKDWVQPLVHDKGALSAAYIQMAPGEKTKTMFYADVSIWWVVESGQIRFTIAGQQPFVASHNFIVQVPARVPFSLETVGDTPSLRFEVTHTRATPMYPITETPTPVKGAKYIKIAYGGGLGSYGNARPYLDYDKEIAQGGGRAPAGFVRDGETSANVIRGPGVPRPPDSVPGHFHDGSTEFFFVLEGHLNLLTEGVPFINAAEPGDVLYAPAGRWHRTGFAGEGMSGRISIHPVTQSLNLNPDDGGPADN